MEHPSRSHISDVREYYRTVGPFLELEQANRNDEAFWRRAVAESPEPRVLELGMGSGRATVHLAEAASVLIGLDVAAPSLKQARNRLRRHSNVHLLLADIRAIPLVSSFDLIVAANDPFVHMSGGDDRDRALKLIAERLAGSGRFILDAHWFAPSARREAERPAGRIRERRLGEPNDGLSVRETWHCDRETGRCHAQYEYIRRGARVGVAAFQGRLWSPDEIDERFARAGLEVSSRWGSYELDPWDPETSRRLVIEAVPAGT